MARVISCSRRTDLPAFYSSWLLNRLRAGYCLTYNPFGGQLYRISLTPEDCLVIGFWTRNPAPLYPHLDELDARGYRYYFNVSILGYPQEFETHNPALEVSIHTFQKFSKRLAPWRMVWRYDPVILSSATPVEYHLDRFENIAQALEGYTQHCTFSFLTYYGKTTRNLASVTRQTDIHFDHPSLTEQQELAGQLTGIAEKHGMHLHSCCNDALLVDGVLKNHCVDPDLVGRLAPEQGSLPGFKPTRKDCGCLASTDIGVYEMCLFGCTYCYATNSRAAALQRRRSHDPRDSILWRPEHLVGQDLEKLAVALKE